MTAIVDYGVGNLFSVCSSLKYIGEDATVTGDKQELFAADRVILPGVGAFGDAADKLRENGLDKVLLEIAESGKPLLGICLGMQLLFDSSDEYGEHRGLSLIPGRVTAMEPIVGDKLKIPHMGWNALNFHGKSNPLFRYINEGDFVYFVHSYYGVCKNDEDLAATAEYGFPVCAAVSHGNVYGTQFHPEKSGEVGMNILRAFTEMN